MNLLLIVSVSCFQLIFSSFLQLKLMTFPCAVSNHFEKKNHCPFKKYLAKRLTHRTLGFTPACKEKCYIGRTRYVEHPYILIFIITADQNNPLEMIQSRLSWLLTALQVMNVSIIQEATSLIHHLLWCSSLWGLCRCSRIVRRLEKWIIQPETVR